MWRLFPSTPLLSFPIPFVCRRAPGVQILVDGEPVITLVQGSSSGSASSGLHSTSRPFTSGGFPGGEGAEEPRAGNVTGLTTTDYLSLPPKAKIAVTVHGGELRGAQGFLALQKL
jgi:hypothetical protein